MIGDDYLKKKTVISLMVSSGLLLSTTTLLLACLNVQNGYENDRKACSGISNTLYNIVEEAYLNYGNIEYSKYKDIVPERFYNRYFCYLDKTDNSKPYDADDPDSRVYYLDRSKLDILISYHSEPVTTLDSADTATSIFTAKILSKVTDSPSYRDDHTYYGDDYSGGTSTYVVKWKKQDDGKWHIEDVEVPYF